MEDVEMVEEDVVEDDWGLDAVDKVEDLDDADVVAEDVGG